MKKRQWVIVLIMVLIILVCIGAVVGLYIGLAAFGVGALAQTTWLWWRSRPAVRALQARDGALSTAAMGLSR